MKLYDIPIEAADIEAALSEGFGELTVELEARIETFLAEGKEKIEAAAMVVRSLEGDALICQEEAERLQARAQSLGNAVARLKALMLFAVDHGFAGKVKTHLFTIWGQTSGTVTAFELKPSKSIFEVPTAFIRTKDPELDKKALKEAHAAGIAIPDCLEVSEVPGTRFLRIK